MTRHDLQGAIVVHPGPSAYNKGCRCEECKALHRQRCQAVRAAMAARPDDVPHGPSGYRNWGCRCETCVHAGSLSNARGRAKRKRARGQPLSALETLAVTS